MDHKVDSLHCCSIHFGVVVVVVYEGLDGRDAGSHVNDKGLRHLGHNTLLSVYDDNPFRDEGRTPCGTQPNDEDNMGLARVLDLNSLN